MLFNILEKLCNVYCETPQIIMMIKIYKDFCVTCFLSDIRFRNFSTPVYVLYKTSIEGIMDISSYIFQWLMSLKRGINDATCIVRRKVAKRCIMKALARFLLKRCKKILSDILMILVFINFKNSV